MSEQEMISVIDDLYYSLYGGHQTKEGQTLERLLALRSNYLKKSENSVLPAG